MKTSEVFKRFYKTHTIAGIIDELAKECPNELYASIPDEGTSGIPTWTDISIFFFSQMIDKAAWWLVDNLGHGGKDYESIHFVVPGDLASLVWVLASWKAGYKGIFCHPIATAEIHKTIIDSLDCNILLFSGELPEKARALLTSRPQMRAIAAPGLDYWIEHPLRSPFDYPRTLSEAKDTPMIVVHSSGTTGPPKAVTFTQGSFMLMVGALQSCEHPERLNYAAMRGQHVASLVPTTIAAGLFHDLGANFSFDYTIAFRRMSDPPSAETFNAMLQHAKVTAMVTAPPILIEMMDKPDVYERFKKNVKTVIYAGAPLPTHIGDVLAHKTQLCGTYGSTETGVYPIYLNAPNDWSYYEYDPVFKSALQPVGKIGYHEVVLPRKDESVPFQAAFTLFPECQEWRTKDVFLQHEDANKKNLWRYVGRTDDFIEDSGKEGESAMDAFIPNDVEAVMVAGGRISGAVICANRGGDIATIIETPAVKDGQAVEWTAETRAETIRSIQRDIDAANEKCPIAGKIRSDLVLLASEPMVRGTKGYPVRARMLEKYAAAIDEAYLKRQNDA